MKQQNRIFFSILFTFSFLSVSAQYTEVINSNKPGFSESPYSVGSGIYQFENNIFFQEINTESTFSIPQSLGIDFLFRTSFFLEKLELNAQLTYQKDQITSTNTFTPQYSTTGFSKATIGAKYLLFQQEYTDKTKEIRSWKKRNAFDTKRLIPSVALYIGLNTDFVNDIYKTQKMSPKVGVLLQNDLSDSFNIITNFYYDKIGTDFSEYSYIVTATYSFGGNWSTFIENQGVFFKNQTKLNLGTGFAYLFNKNFQINISGRALSEDKTFGYFAGVGASYRINKHKDSYIDLDNYGTTTKDTPISRYNKKKNSFFSRIFSIFKKKKTTRRTRKRN